ncbi:MAG: cell division protein ZapB [Acidobacteria bacterium]|nr:MAG: cell division protein ZapB [Acidobacteriota bacterium]TDI12222.1 MAG: cell division protein ZapB [Acidobacteriota bacterium]TDI15739.1 MAG: cell division protein ZapB [Acidobacteriota bacterium]
MVRAGTWVTVSNKSLDQLESRVTQVVQLVSSLQTENKVLEEEVEKLRKNVEEVKKDNSTKNQLIQQFKNDRLRIRSRVERIAAKVVALEEFS